MTDGLIDHTFKHVNLSGEMQGVKNHLKSAIMASENKVTELISFKVHSFSGGTIYFINDYMPLYNTIINQCHFSGTFLLSSAKPPPSHHKSRRKIH